MEQVQLVRDFRTSECYDMVSSLYSHPLYLGLAGNRYRTDFIYVSNQTGVPLLYRWDPATNKSHLLTPGEETVFPIFGGMALPYDPSSPKVAFAKDKAGDLNYSICVVDYSQNKIERITKDPLGQVLHIFWVTDDKWIVVGHDMKTIYLRFLEADGTIHDLYTTDLQITGASYDHQRGLVAFSVGRGQDARVAVLPISNPSDVHWAPDQGMPPYNPPAVHSEKGLLAYTVDAQSGSQEIAIVSFPALETIKHVPIPGTGYMDWLDENHLFGMILKEGRLAPLTLDLQSEKWSEPLADISALFSTVTRDGPVWTANSISQPPFLQALRNDTIVNLTKPTQEASFHAQSQWYTSFDGRKIHGWLVKSPIPDAKLVVYLHGGPTALQGDWWYPELSALVLGGFHVFAPNFRGSDGYGAEFRDLNIGDLGGGDLEDVQYAAKHAHQVLGLKSKPAAVGGSYGGYLTLMALMIHPDDWAGGVAIAPPTDYVDEYYADDAHYRTWCTHFFGGTPEEKKELYRDRSPITHLDKLKASVLIIAGENDSIVTLNLVRKFAEEAEKVHRPVELFVAKDEGHGSLQSVNAIRDNILMVEHLKGIYNQ